MSRLTLSVVLLALAGCSPGGTVTITGLYREDQLKQPCQTVPKNTDVLALGGTLDAADPSSYYLAAILESDLTSGGNGSDLTVAGTVLSAPNSNVPVLDDLVLSYNTNIAGKTIQTSHHPVLMPFANGDSKATLGVTAMNLISRGTDQAAYEVLKLDPPVPEKDLDLRVNIEFRGKMSRSLAPVTTGPVIYPITVYSLPPTAFCTTGYQSTFSCPGGGQDGRHPANCCDSLPAGTLGCP